MAPIPTSKSDINPCSSSQLIHVTYPIMTDDDFQESPSPSFSTVSRTNSHPPRLKPQNSNTRCPPRNLKNKKSINPGKENCFFDETEADLGCGLDSIEPTLDLLNPKGIGDCLHNNNNSLESRLLEHKGEEVENTCDEEELLEEGSTQFDVLLKLCAEVDEPGSDSYRDDSEGKCDISICCPLCGADISGLRDDLRQIHTNECLDKLEGSATDVAARDDDRRTYQCPGQVLDGSPFKSVKEAVDASPVVEWLRNLGLAKYEEIFIRQEIDWKALQWLTEEDLCGIGITALGPRKKILHALRELRNNSTRAVEPKADLSKGIADESKLGTNKLITDYFSGPLSERKRGGDTTNIQNNVRRSQAISTHRSIQRNDRVRKGKQKDVPLWCCIPGTPFRVDAFKYLRRDCFHWFLTHFHLDQLPSSCTPYLHMCAVSSYKYSRAEKNYGDYQGLTRSFCHGIIYCSSITAKLINLKIGISSDKIQVLPLNQKINVAGIDVTCFDANHCPGAIIILFEPPNGKPVLHTGDFRFCEEMKDLSILQSCPIHTLILDTTYCNPQYDFPKQDAIIQFVIDAIQAEAFNPKTLFLIGSYTIGKEKLFIEVARALRKKVYVTAAKLRLLECLDLQHEEMQWFTLNEQESHIHVVPMWTIASFKRLKQMSNQYMGRFSLIVAVSPTGWSFGKGKKSTGRRWQQGTIIRYEVPYSEHSSFTELKEFVKFLSPVDIIPSVNNDGPDAHNSMVSQLLA
ncbi:UNVERIFIED_CONTAM: DNA cross-link repair 1A protein [Sesamum angustifolium]|uniref:DNA cross-link repair 1A protein n=1 Tax=Sesamum angustifolium TaxID=2727405 RepID=A0AAW2MK10_9LAMI